MNRFQNVLVGVDLSCGDLFVSDKPNPPSQEAIQRALWLAKNTQARLKFFTAVDVGPRAEMLIQEIDGFETTVIDKANTVLSDAAQQARREHINADFKVVMGKSWLELIREVLTAKHDLLVVGSRQVGTIRGLLWGSTCSKLLRKCPCAVWIVQPSRSVNSNAVLAATDFTTVSDLAVDLAASMAELNGSELHIVHAFESPTVTDAPTRELLPMANAIQQFHEEAFADAELNLQAALRRDAVIRLPKTAHTHLLRGSPAEVICNAIKDFAIHLVVMGTVGKTGLAGMIMGNTAERLLPRIPCSILAIKPDDFESPIKKH